MDADDPVIDWLLEPADASVRCLAMTDLLGLSGTDVRVQATRDRIPDSPHVRNLLAGQQEDGGFGCHPYQKWYGAHWRLVSLVDLGIPAGHPQCLAAAEHVLQWLTGPAHRGKIKSINGLVRRCASQEGNVLGVCCHLGLADDPRVQLLAESLMEWQWPDGGWNCDKNPRAHHSSFHESLKPMWGLLKYHQATGDAAALAAAQRTAELLLDHRLFRSSTTGAIINQEWTRLHWPAYWHYDILGALDVLRELDGALSDPRTDEALTVIQEQRLPDGKWRHTGKRYWRRPLGEGAATSGRPSGGAGLEVTDWGHGRRPSKFITLRALRVLKCAGRLN